MGPVLSLFQQPGFFKRIVDLKLIKTYYVLFSDLYHRNSHLSRLFNEFHRGSLVTGNVYHIIFDVERRKILLRLITPRSGIGRKHFNCHSVPLLLWYIGKKVTVNYYNANPLNNSKKGTTLFPSPRYPKTDIATWTGMLLFLISQFVA